MAHSLKILIVEDELLIAEMLKETLFDLGYEILAIATNFAATFDYLEKMPEINFVFLDINLGKGQNGFAIAEKLNTDFQIPFLFLTSYSESSTIQVAINLKPQGYLIKPFTKSDLFITLELYKAKYFDEGKTIELKDGHFSLKLKHVDILWIKSENIYIEIKTIDKLHVIRTSIEKFMEKLNDDDFIKIHRSYAVNLQHIKAVNRVHIIVQNEKLPISRMHHDELVKRFLK